MIHVQHMREPRRAAGPQSRAGKIALLGPVTGLMGYVCARFIVLLADVRPYMGWYWLLAVVAGIAIAAGLPWAFIRGARRSSGRWQGWALAGYVLALGGGLKYYWSVRFNAPPVGVPVVLPQPPLWFALVVAGLTAVTLTYAAITLLLLVVLAEVIAPGHVGGRIRAWRVRRASAPRKRRPLDESIPARLRLASPDGGLTGQWLRGVIHVRPGSLLWEPGKGVQVPPIDLTTATVVPQDSDSKAKSKGTAFLATSAGQIQLDHDTAMVALLQRIAAEQRQSTRFMADSAEDGPVVA
jgi:hypothetical protein